MRSIITTAAVLGMAGLASASVAIDGVLDAAYGPALAVQTTQTQFGDSAGGFSGGGELNAMYVTSDGTNLNILITGNVETNFNKVNIFIDSIAGGENTLGNLAYDFGGTTANLAGMTFASGFEADYHLIARTGGGIEVDFIDRQGGMGVLGDTGVGALDGSANGSGMTTGVANGAAAGVLTTPMQFAYNASNAAGVTGGTGAADMAAAAAVTTGLEISIALADLGLSVGDEVRFFAGYGNGDHNFWSNQFLPGLPNPQGNLGGDGNGNFTGTAGIDVSSFGFVSYTVVPAPGAAALFGVAGLAGIRRRR